MDSDFPGHLRRLDGKIVLVKSASDRGHPPAGVRGTIEVSNTNGSRSLRELPEVKLVWEIPDMFNDPAHHCTAVLRDEKSLQALLASERDGTFEFTVDSNLE